MCFEANSNESIERAIAVKIVRTSGDRGFGDCSPLHGKLEARETALFDRTFRDSNGNIVIAQMPNLSLSVWLAATLLKFLPTGGNVHIESDAIAFSALFT